MHMHDIYAIFTVCIIFIVVLLVLRVSPADIWQDFTSKDEHSDS